jgi:maltose O-acetyltransferase
MRVPREQCRSATPRRAVEVLQHQLGGVRVRHVLARLLVLPLPILAGSRVRAFALRLAGFRVGRGVVLADMPRIFGEGRIETRLTIGDHCFLNVGTTIELGDRISIGRWVTFGPEVMLLTTTHEIGGPDHRCSTPIVSPIEICDGAWIGARATVLPGVTVGSGAVVGAGSLVLDDVEPNTVVAGSPARLIRRLDESRTPTAG